MKQLCLRTRCASIVSVTWPLFALALLFAVPVSASAQSPIATQNRSAAAAIASDQPRESQPGEQSGQAQQSMKEARAELDRAADALDALKGDEAMTRLVDARNALDQFDQSLDQLDQSVPGYVQRELADSLHDQVARAMDLLDSDPIVAAEVMRELALRVTDLSAEANLLIGRPLMGPDGETVGNISNVLIDGQGRILSLIVDRIGAGRNLQFTVGWEDVTVKGRTLNALILQSATEDLPDYNR